MQPTEKIEVKKLGKNEFSLEDMYAFEKELSKLHPENTVGFLIVAQKL